MDKILELEKIRKSSYEQYKKDNLIGVLSALGAVASFILAAVLAGQSPLYILFIILLVVAIVFASIYLSKSAKVYKSFKQTIQPQIVEFVLNKHFDRYEYKPNESINHVRINQTGMVRPPDRQRGNNYLSGSYKGVEFEVSSHNFERRVEYVDSKGNRHYRYDTYFNGRWIIYKYEKEFKEILKIAEAIPYSTKGLERFETESITFNKTFNVYATKKEFLFYLVNSLMLEKLAELESKLRGHMHFAFIGNELHIGINDSFNFLDLKFKNEISQENIEKFEQQIILIGAIINEFRLDSNKYKNI